MAVDTKYWIEVAMGTATNQGTVFWEATTDTTVEGEPAVQFNATAGVWAIPLDANGDPNVNQEVIYNYAGECTPIGAGPVVCSQEHTAAGSMAGSGVGSSLDSDFKTASDITVTAGEADLVIDLLHDRKK